MLGEFPKLEVGENEISWSGTLTKITIEPKSRWL
jgi:phage-related protein